VTRDGMPRAYLRLDPNIDQTHPDLAAFVRLMCAAARQPERGRFRNLSQLQALFGKRKAHELVARDDVVQLADGRYYVEGWDEWQEGDHTVAERMRRMRERRKNKRKRVTPPASPDRNGVTTDAGTTDSNLDEGVGGSDDVLPPNPPPSGGRGLRAHGKNPRKLAEQEREAERQRAHEARLEATRRRIEELSRGAA
jgi:hypothetical protein